MDSPWANANAFVFIEILFKNVNFVDLKDYAFPCITNHLTAFRAVILHRDECQSPISSELAPLYRFIHAAIWHHLWVVTWKILEFCLNELWLSSIKYYIKLCGTYFETQCLKKCLSKDHFLSIITSSISLWGQFRVCRCEREWSSVKSWVFYKVSNTVTSPFLSCSCQGMVTTCAFHILVICGRECSCNGEFCNSFTLENGEKS